MLIPVSKEHAQFWHDLEKVSSVGEVARLWETDKRVVMYWIDAGHIVAIQLGGDYGQWIVSLDSVIAYKGLPTNLDGISIDIT